MVCTAARMRSCSLWFVGIVFNRVSGPVTSVARVEDVQIFLKDPVHSVVLRLYENICRLRCKQEVCDCYEEKSGEKEWVVIACCSVM